MKLNNKGFAITSILYAVLILFLVLVGALMTMLVNRKLSLDKYKETVKDNLNNSSETYGAYVALASGTEYIRIAEDEFSSYDMKKDVSGCLIGGTNEVDGSLCASDETDITSRLNYKIYDDDNNEIIEFISEKFYGEPGFGIQKIKYKYYEKDENNQYIIEENKLKEKVKQLNLNEENKFYIHYFVVDDNNLLSKDTQRTIIVMRYDNYINVKNVSVVIPSSGILTYNFKQNADSYKMENELVKDNSLLNYQIYDENDKLITKFINSNGIYYVTSNGNTKVTSEMKFRVRYYTNTIEKPTSDIEYGYFSIE